MNIIESYKKITVLHHVEPDGTLWGTSGRKILKKVNDGAWQTIAEFPFIAKRDLLGFTRISARALRADKCNLYVNKHGSVLGIRSGTVYAIQAEQPPRPLFEINGDSVLHGGICEDQVGNIYFGEYFMNPSRHPVCVWRVSADLSTWEVAHEFPANSIRHAHGVYPDPYKPNRFWITTGDFADECYFYTSNDGFKSFERFGDGTQNWRAVRIFFTPTHIGWLTDSNLEQNFACRMARETGALEIGQKIDASGWYGTTTKEGLHLAFTTVEPGNGILTDKASIFVSDDAFTWELIEQYKKDYWRPMKVFKYGVIATPSGVMSNTDVYLSGEGLLGLDGNSVKVAL